MADLGEFLEHNVQGYLFHDLRVMQDTCAPDGAPGGALGYPLLMTAVAGIELLGALLSTEPFDTHKGAKYFARYWTQFLYPDKAGNADQADFVYKLARHGIAHMFLLKGRAGVVKGQPAYHLAHGPAGEFYIDASQPASDLIDSYQARVKPVLADAESSTRQSMQQRLSEIADSYLSQTTVGPPGPTGVTGVRPSVDGPSQGASGPWGPSRSDISRAEGMS